MTGRSSPRRHDVSPGPAAYGGGRLSEAAARSSPRYGFGGAGTGRLERGRETSPGPGAYGHQQHLGDQGKCSWLYTSPEQQDRQWPGGVDFSIGNGDEAAGSSPGHNPQVAHKRTKAEAAPLQRRHQPTGVGAGARALSPRGGPEVANRRSPGYSMPGRREASPLKLPGPGEYEHQRASSPGVMYRFGRSLSRPRQGSPRNSVEAGPGAYNIPSDLGTSGFTFSHRHESPPPAVPGPGAYADHSGATSPLAARHVFGRSPARPNRSPMRGSEPAVGPGSYELPAKFGTVSAFTAGMRRETPQPAVPGPGTYDTGFAASPTASRCSFTKSPARPNVVAGRTERSPAAVGPGAYNVDHVPQGPKFSMSARLAVSTPVLPGPGSYNTPSLRSASPPMGCSFKGSRPTSPRADKDFSAGPGSYQVGAASSALTGTGRAWSIQPRREERPADVPGPGAYEPPPAFGV